MKRIQNIYVLLSMMEVENMTEKCQNERTQDLGFKDNHPLVLCIRCLRFVDSIRFGRSIFNKDLKICCRCCNEEKHMMDKDWIDDLERMRQTEENKEVEE